MWDNGARRCQAGPPPLSPCCCVDLELNKPEVIGVSQVMSGRDHGTAPGPGFPLPEPKFHPPGTRPGIIVRTTLVERLAAAQAPVIIVTAPPGYGKTTLMARSEERHVGKEGRSRSWRSHETI